MTNHEIMIDDLPKEDEMVRILEWMGKREEND